MSDEAGLFCLNPDCGERQKRNRKGAYPKYCPECDKPLPEPELPSVAKCPHCDEELSKNRKGLYPKNCPECNKPTGLQQESTQEVLRCYDPNCNEPIPKNKRGEYVKVCVECEKPVHMHAQETQHVLECPKCGEPRVRTRAGKLYKTCIECQHVYDADVDAWGIGTESFPVQSASMRDHSANFMAEPETLSATIHADFDPSSFTQTEDDSEPNDVQNIPDNNTFNYDVGKSDNKREPPQQAIMSAKGNQFNKLPKPFSDTRFSSFTDSSLELHFDMTGASDDETKQPKLGAARASALPPTSEVEEDGDPAQEPKPLSCIPAANDGEREMEFVASHRMMPANSEYVTTEGLASHLPQLSDAYEGNHMGQKLHTHERTNFIHSQKLNQPNKAQSLRAFNFHSQPNYHGEPGKTQTLQNLDYYNDFPPPMVKWNQGKPDEIPRLDKGAEKQADLSKTSAEEDASHQLVQNYPFANQQFGLTSAEGEMPFANTGPEGDSQRNSSEHDGHLEKNPENKNANDHTLGLEKYQTEPVNEPPGGNIHGKTVEGNDRAHDEGDSNADTSEVAYGSYGENYAAEPTQHYQDQMTSGGQAKLLEQEAVDDRKARENRGPLSEIFEEDTDQTPATQFVHAEKGISSADAHGREKPESEQTSDVDEETGDDQLKLFHAKNDSEPLSKEEAADESLDSDISFDFEMKRNRKSDGIVGVEEETYEDARESFDLSLAAKTTDTSHSAGQKSTEASGDESSDTDNGPSKEAQSGEDLDQTNTQSGIRTRTQVAAELERLATATNSAKTSVGIFKADVHHKDIVAGLASVPQCKRENGGYAGGSRRTDRYNVGSNRYDRENGSQGRGDEAFRTRDYQQDQGTVKKGKEENMYGRGLEYGRGTNLYGRGATRDYREDEQYVEKNDREHERQERRNVISGASPSPQHGNQRDQLLHSTNRPGARAREWEDVGCESIERVATRSAASSAAPRNEPEHAKTADYLHSGASSEQDSIQSVAAIATEIRAPEEESAGEKADFTACMMEMKDKIEQAKQVLHKDKVLSRKCTSEWMDLWRWGDSADRKLSVYNHSVRQHESKQNEKSENAVRESTNGLRSFYNANSRALNKILKTCSLPQLQIEELPKDKTSSSLQHQTPAIKVQRTVKVTFKAVLSKHIYKKFRGLSMVVFSSINAFKRSVAKMERGDDGIWTGTWNAPTTLLSKTIEYKYFVFDGYTVGTGIWEWLGETSSKRVIINRYLSFPSTEQDVVMYDGIVLYKQEYSKWNSTINATKRFFGWPKDSQQEQERGIQAMFPRWADEITRGTSVHTLVQWILQALQRQSECLSGFQDFTKDWNTTRSNEMKKVVDNVFTDYIWQSVEDHMVMVYGEAASASLASLAGLIHMVQHQPQYQKPLAKIGRHIPDLIRATITNEGMVFDENGIDAFLAEFLEKLQDDGKFVRDVKSSLLECIHYLSSKQSRFSSHDDSWLMLIPLLHLLTEVSSEEPNVHGDDYDNPKWWGVEEFQMSIDALKRSSSDIKLWKTWITWMAPYFAVDNTLPYSFLALLNASQLSGLLDSEEEVIKYLLPLDGILACCRYHMKSLSNPSKMEKMIEGLLDLLRNLFARNVFGVEEICLELAKEILEMALPGDSKTVKKLFFNGVQIYLQIMEGLLARNDCHISVYGGNLHTYVDRFTSICDIFKVHRSGESISKDEIKNWSYLFTCESGNAELVDWWLGLCQKFFKQRLAKVTNDNPAAIVDLYCTHDFEIPAMEETVAGLAESKAEFILKEGQVTIFSHGIPDKIRGLIVKGLYSLWSSGNDDPMGVVQKMIDLGNFLPVWRFCASQLDEELESRLCRAAQSLEMVIERLTSGNLTFEQFTFLEENKASVLGLCEISKSLRERRIFIAESFEKRAAEKLFFLNFHTKLSDFLNFCEGALSDKRQLQKWLKRRSDGLVFCENVNPEPLEVKCPHIPAELVEILQQFANLKRRPIFQKLFMKKIQKTHNATIDGLFGVFHSVVDKYESTKSLIVDGTLSMRQLDQQVERYFGGKREKFIQEMENMVDGDTYATRKHQIEMCSNLHQYHQGARVMLNMKDLFELTGDFSGMEKILESADKKLMLKEITEDLLASAGSIRHITARQISCLQVFTKYPDFVEWVRKEVPSKDIDNFVDLASSTLGEDDLAAEKTRYLLNALNGYTPLLYEFDKEKTDYNSFIELCKRVWESLAQNEALEENLRQSAEDLEWLKKVNSYFGGTEIKTMAQATAINETGKYYVGNIPNHSRNFKTLEDVMLLKCKIEQKGGEKKEKFYTYSELKDLQSKLALVAGEKQRENKETIQKFESMRDAVENLAKAYIDIRREGCIQFDDMLVVVHCRPQDKTGIEVRLQSINKVMSGRNTEKQGGALEHCQDLYTYMNNCVKKWRESMNDYRREHAELNFYTTEQLVVLRRELAMFYDSKNPQLLNQSQPLLARIDTIESSLLLEFITEYSRLTAPKEEEAEPEEDEVESVTVEIIPYSRMSDDQKDLVDELHAEYEDYTEALAVQAVNDLGEEAEIDAYIEWIDKYTREFAAATKAAAEPEPEDFTSNLETSVELMKKLMVVQSRGATLQDKLEVLWTEFIALTRQSIKDFLGITHLAFALNRIKAQKTSLRYRRRLPTWLGRGKPWLIAAKEHKVYQMVLTVYASDPDYTPPTTNEVLICNRRTRAEEVALFLDRALNDPLSFYCMVNCHLLENNVCRVIENRLSNTADDTVKDYGLAFIYAEERRDARIRAYLDKHLVKNPELAVGANLAAYVQKALKVSEDVNKTACSVDELRSLARLIRSERAGVGKSLRKKTLCDELSKDKSIRGVDITIPIYKTVNTDHIIDILTSELGNGYTDTPHNTIHIDIAHEVESGVDELLFNLIILRSIVNSEGVVWQAQNTQYYIIECMPYTRKDGSCAHEVLDMLPTTMCQTPGKVAQVYEAGEPYPDGFIGFNPDVLMEHEWQVVLKYLQCKESNDNTYTTSEVPFCSLSDALRLLTNNCGLKDPTWSELRHYVYFLSSQLFKVEASPYCLAAMANDLPGFRLFVIEFMFRMAQDFATRSLKIAEETPGLALETGDGVDAAQVLEQLSIKRTWESGNHPYLFFNEDEATFTPLGFFVVPQDPDKKSFNLVDCHTQEVLKENCMNENLKVALDGYNLSMSEDFDKLPRTAQLDKLRDVMVKRINLSREVKGPDGKPHIGRDGEVTRIPEEMFKDHDDPNENYVLTMDNAKKILAIHQRLRVDIPVIIMGETGCGKTLLIEFMSQLQVPTALKEKIKPMVIVKIHGGTTEEDIIQKVTDAQNLALENKRICEEYAAEFESTQVPTVYTILFLDEANTTEAIGLVKEILCDGRMRGKPLKKNSGLKIIAACNPYRRHTDAMIEKLKKAGLGYNVDESETKDKFGQIPMRHLVYRVQALSQSLLPLVWDFGTLRSADLDSADSTPKKNIESAYIEKMIMKFNQLNKDGIDFADKAPVLAETLAATQSFMRKQKDECSFVSLRDVQRLLQVTGWFYSQKDPVFTTMDAPADDDIPDEDQDRNEEEDEMEEEEEEHAQPRVHNLKEDYSTRSIVLALGVCYLARLEDATRVAYAEFINDKIELLIGGGKDRNSYKMSGSEFLFHQIELCQDMFVNEVVSVDHKNIAKNKALKENVFMMIVCIENRIPLFLVGKPGSSKSLSKSMVVDAMKGKRSESAVFKKMKQSYTVSFQCSRHATAAGIVGVFNHCAKFQKDQDLDAFVSVVVLDEVGLAEDSENMPLKALHPLLEDGSDDSSKAAEDYMKCAFVGISNWALDPAKMNRGIFVQRGTPESKELEQIAKEICGSTENGDNDVRPFIGPLAAGYLDICIERKPEQRDLTEFFGLRDFYSLVKMVVNFAQSTGSLNRNQLEHSIRRNFGGFDPAAFDPMEVFAKHCALESLELCEGGRPPTDPIGLIQSSLSGEDTALNGMESRYLLILTESLSVLSIIQAEFDTNGIEPEVVFGSKFRDDVSYTQVCHNIYRIKTCMDMGKPVILLNLDDLYESLYDALNQYFYTWGVRKFVDIGLGTHRVKTFVNDKFRLVVVADKNKVHSQFPIPLINRLEKHYVSATSFLKEDQKQVKAELEEWARKFATPQRAYTKVCPTHCEGCGVELTKPYRLSCQQHYVGPCCKQKIEDGQMEPQCPVAECSEEIMLEEWEVDTAALENRQYFDNSMADTAFVGYSSETTALVVRKVVEEADETPIEYKQLLERSKFHLLQCATVESVLRLNKTELAHEAKKIQNMYMEEQNHETLLQYLQHELPKAGDSSLFIQATSFAELMNRSDIQSLSVSLSQSGQSVEIFDMLLKDFVREDQFTASVSSNYQRQSKRQSKLLLLQCESATENIELLDSVRFIIQRESAAAFQQQGDDAVPTHTLLLLNLPRGDVFTGYQGGKWKCVHIDDPKSPQIKLPSLSKCLKLHPSDIIEKVMKKFLAETHSAATGDSQEEKDVDVKLKEEEGHRYQAAVATPSTDLEDSMFDDMLLFIIQCLPEAVSGIMTDFHYDRVFILKQLLTNDDEFARIFLQQVHGLLKKQEEHNPTVHWLISDAAKASNMKQSETMRHSLEDALERAFVPALAAVISFIDVRQNLLIMVDTHSDLRGLWLQIFDQCHKLGLVFNQITKQQDSKFGQAKLPRHYKIQEVGNGLQNFRTRLPFAWIVKDTIDSLVRTRSGLEFSEALAQQFKMSAIGQVILADQNMGRHMEILDAYMIDFVHMTHPCCNKAEHLIVGNTLMKYLQSEHQEASMVNITISYHQQKSMFENLSAVFNLTGKDSKLFPAVQKQVDEFDVSLEQDELRCDLLALRCFLETFDESRLNEILRDPEYWVENVERCKLVVKHVLHTSQDHEGDCLAICRTKWMRLCMKKLYVEHIIVPSPVLKTGSRSPHKLRNIFKIVTGESFQSYDTFLQVVNFLKEALAERIRSLYPNCPSECPQCGESLDSPIRLTCKHLMCDTCVKEVEICQYKDCGEMIPKPYNYDPASDDIDENKLKNFKDLRRRMNIFFMTFVADIVFNGDEDPDDQIINWLLERATFGNERKTRQFSLFNSEDVVDATPVVRSFLLKLLLSCKQDLYVIEYLDQTLASWTDQPAHQLQAMVLLMDCQKDMLGHQILDQDTLCDNLEDYRDVFSEPVDQPTVHVLRDIADVQRCISQAIDYLSNDKATDQRKLGRALQQFLNDAKQHGNPQPGYLVVRQLFANYGEGYVKDLLETAHNYSIPDDVAAALKSFVVPDVLAVYGGDPFKAAQTSLNKVASEKYPSEAFTTAVEEFKKSDMIMILHVLFTGITRELSASGPVTQDMRKGLLEELKKSTEDPQRLALLEMLLQDGRLPREMDVNQSSGINLSMLVLNLYSCLCSGGVMADLYPLSEIINQPDQAAAHFFPTMADNQQEYIHSVLAQALKKNGENTTIFKCPNGHKYMIGNCGRPVGQAVCYVEGCGAKIGSTGSYNVAAKGNEKVTLTDGEDKTQPGHTLGEAMTDTAVIKERRTLNLLSCAVLRILTHLSMYTASLFNKDKVLAMIHPNLPNGDAVGPFLKAHIQLDLQQISQCCAESTDDCILLIHGVINRMKQATHEGLNVALENMSIREEWEQKFDLDYITPAVQNQGTIINEMKKHVDIKRLLSTSDKHINETNVIASAGLWNYRRPLTLAAVQNKLGSTVKNFPRLKDIADNCHILMAVKYLPDILTLLKAFNDKFHSRFSRAETSKMRIEDFCRRHGKEIPGIYDLIENFIFAWNIICKQHGGAGERTLKKLNRKRSVLSNFLIDQLNSRDSIPFILVVILTDAHNSRLSFDDEKRPKVPLSAVTPTNIIGIESSDEILSLIASHSEYELRETTAITYNWPAIEREVLHRYISNKPRIEFSRDQLPCYVYQEDFNLHNQMQAISDSQVPMSSDLQTFIVNALPLQVKSLTQHLKDLKTVINFLSVMKHIEGNNSLFEYMKATFGKEPSYLSKNVKLKHAIHVWLVVKYTQTDLLMKQHQEPFDDISAECKEGLSKELEEKLNLCCQSNSPKTKQLLQELFKFIILRLNKAAGKQDPENPEKGLHDALTEFIAYRSNESDEAKIYELLEYLPDIPEEVKVKHGSKAWHYIWKRFTAKD